MTWAWCRADRQHAHFIILILLQYIPNGILIPRSLLRYIALMGREDAPFGWPTQPILPSHGIASPQEWLDTAVDWSKEIPSVSSVVTDTLPFVCLCRIAGSISFQGASWKGAWINQLEVAASPYIWSVREGKQTTSSKTMVKRWITYPSHLQ